MKTALILEIKKQLDKAGIVINDLSSTLDKLYIDPYTHYDMNGYVDVIGGEYRLRICERGGTIFDKKTVKVKTAAYFILREIVNRVVMKSAQPFSDEGKQLEAEYFAKMDDDYARWHSEGINDFNIGKIL